MDMDTNIMFSSLVISGNWNTAILNNPEWIAGNVLGNSGGEKVDLRLVQAIDPSNPVLVFPAAPILEFDKFRLSCNHDRLEFHVPELRGDECIYDVVSKLCELLPYTPITAVGVNFDATVASGPNTVSGLLETKENLYTYGNLLERSLTDTIEIDRDQQIGGSNLGKPRSILNITRKNDFKTVKVEFNYHTEIIGTEELAAYISQKPINHWHDHATKLAEAVYSFG